VSSRLKVPQALLTQKGVNLRAGSVLDSIWTLALGLARDGELHILPDSKSFWPALKGRVVEEELPRPFTALDEPKLAPHGDDLQNTSQL